MNKFIYFIFLSIAIHQGLVAMDQKKDPTQAQVPCNQVVLEDGKEQSSEESGRRPFIINLTVDKPPQQQVQREPTPRPRKHTISCVSDLARITINPAAASEDPEQQAVPVPAKPLAKRRTASIRDLASIKIEPAQTPDLPSAKSVTFQIDMQDLAKASPERLNSVIDELIRQASLLTFASEDLNAFYVSDLKAELLESFREYIAKNQKPAKEDSETSSDNSDTPYPISKTYNSSILEPKQEAVSRLRHAVFKRMSSQELMASRKKAPVAATSASAVPQESDLQVHKDLKEWFLRELELRELRMREHQRELQEKAVSDKEKLVQANRKARYAIAATIVTTVCGIATAFVTYFTTQKHECRS